MHRLCLALLVALALGACGGDSPDKPEDPFAGMFENAGDGPPTFPGNLPPGLGDGSDAAEAMRHAMGKIELTDEMMESYVGLLNKMNELGDDAPTAALLTAHSLDWKRWAGISAAIGRAHLATAQPENIADMEKDLAKARERLGEAAPEQRSRYESQVKMLETQLEHLKKLPKPTELDRKNLEVFRRWEKRLQEAGR